MPFNDIFSRKSEREETKPKIIIDNREKNSLVPSYLSKFGAEIEFKHLEVGDYHVKNIIIERKTISDLKSSIINKRLVNQIEQLKLQNLPILLLIEGISSEDIYEGGIHENALRGFLLSLSLDHKIPVIFTQDAEDTAKYLLVLAKKHENLPPQSILTKRKPESLKEQKQFILESFPGIGPANAIKLLKKFKSLKAIFNASEKDLEEVIKNATEKFRNILD